MIYRDRKFTVMIDERVEKDLKTVPKHVISKFIDLHDELEIDPLTKRSKVNIKQLKGHGDTYRVRIEDYRALDTVDIVERIVRITTVIQRKNVYRNYLIFN